MSAGRSERRLIGTDFCQPGGRLWPSPAVGDGSRRGELQERLFRCRSRGVRGCFSRPSLAKLGKGDPEPSKGDYRYTILEPLTRRILLAKR
jgi:hypothetical protein